MSIVLEALERRAAHSPAATALRSRDFSLTYAQLLDLVRQAGEQLRSLRVEALGLFLDNGIDWVVYDLAALANGVVTVPLPRFFSTAQITHAITDAGLDAILYDLDLPIGVTGSGVALPGCHDSRLQRIVNGEGERFGAGSERAAGIAKISYTSGTTGAPRGVGLERRVIEQTAESLCSAIGDLDIRNHLAILPYATLLENIAGVYVPLMLGRCVCAEPSADVGLTPALGLEPARLQACFNRVRPDSLIVTPQLLEVLCRMAEHGAIDPGCLVFVAVGGARVAPVLLQRAVAAGIPAYEGYGLTEFASVATLNLPGASRPGSIGKPLPGVSLSIAADGEICLSRTALDQAPIHSGDYGSIDADGYVYIEGRKSNRIVLSNGRNVAPEWVEAELDASPAIDRSFVFSQADDHLAALVSSTDTDARIDAEIERVNRQLPLYAQVREWHRLERPFSREQQTLTANGRLRRARIRELLPQLVFTPSVLRGQPGQDHPVTLQERNPC